MSRFTLSRFTSAIQTAAQRLAGRQQVGIDKSGNKYFIDPKSPHRRWVEYPNDILGDTSTVPMSWHSWLRHGRATAPTPSELETEEQSRLAFKAKVASIEEADRKLRMQELAEKHLQDSSASSSSSSASMANMERERDQRGGVGRWNQAGSGVAGGRKQ